MGRSQMPPLSLWLKGSETEPNAKSVPTSSHRNSFTHLCDHDQGKSCYLIPGYMYLGTAAPGFQAASSLPARARARAARRRLD